MLQYLLIELRSEMFSEHGSKKKEHVSTHLGMIQQRWI